MGAKEALIEVKAILDEERIGDFGRIHDFKTVATVGGIVSADAEITFVAAGASNKIFGAAARVAESEIFGVIAVG